MFIKCLVAVKFNWGANLLPIIVECTEEQKENKKHHQAAIDVAIENYDTIKIPDWVIDEADIAFASLSDIFNWKNAEQTCVQ